MNRTALYLTVGLAVVAASFAAAAGESSKDEQTLEKTSSALDKDAARPEGRTAVEARLKSEFKVDDARLQGLRDQKLGYGEMSIALSLAEKMPGGITDANVKAVMAQRQGPPVMGWGEIARKQGVKLGEVIRKTKGLDAAARKQEKAEKKEKGEKAEKDERHEKAEKGERHEKAERAERVEKHEQHEKIERPEHPKH